MGLECGVTQFVFPIDVAGILPLVQLHFSTSSLRSALQESGEGYDRGDGRLNELTLPCLRRLRGSQERVLAAAGAARILTLVKGELLPSLGR